MLFVYYLNFVFVRLIPVQDFKSTVLKGLSLVDDLIKCKDKLKMLCGATSAFQIEKEVHDIEMFGKQVGYEMKNKELELKSTVLLLAEISCIYQVGMVFKRGRVVQ